MHLHAFIDNIIEHLTYDQDNKRLLIIPQPNFNFLDSTTIISPNRLNVKIVYNNKNGSIIHTNTQVVGRFHHALAPSQMRHKLSAAHSIFTKIFDFTTSPLDMIPPSICLAYELTLLRYTHTHINSALVSASRTRPHAVWRLINLFVCPSS